MQRKPAFILDNINNEQTCSCKNNIQRNSAHIIDNISDSLNKYKNTDRDHTENIFYDQNDDATDNVLYDQDFFRIMSKK